MPINGGKCKGDTKIAKEEDLPYVGEEMQGLDTCDSIEDTSPVSQLHVGGILKLIPEEIRALLLASIAAGSGGVPSPGGGFLHVVKSIPEEIQRALLSALRAGASTFEEQVLLNQLASSSSGISCVGTIRKVFAERGLASSPMTMVGMMSLSMSRNP